MKKNVIATLVICILIFLISLPIFKYILDGEEGDKYDYIIYALCAASSVVFAFLIKKLLKK